VEHARRAVEVRLEQERLGACGELLLDGHVGPALPLRVLAQLLQQRIQLATRGLESRVESLFPRYLFLRTDPELNSLAAVRSTKGAVGLVRFGIEPTRVPDHVVARIQDRVDASDGFVRLEAPEFSPGQRVRVTEGALSGWEGVFQCIESGDRVRLLLELLGCRREIVVPRAQLALHL
jgi:transcriptional antiterminator RfaH